MLRSLLSRGWWKGELPEPVGGAWQRFITGPICKLHSGALQPTVGPTWPGLHITTWADRTRAVVRPGQALAHGPCPHSRQRGVGKLRSRQPRVRTAHRPRMRWSHYIGGLVWLELSVSRARVGVGDTLESGAWWSSAAPFHRQPRQGWSSRGLALIVEPILRAQAGRASQPRLGGALPCGNMVRFLSS